ncbi:MAG: Asp-tRNA(Asn)/Glu-tRNA(Gln) amidotransferase subunit GatB [Deltaproteobacteria bacterium]|nr:Asp-tRNA(Asn)/Glu-tRNA(Gln) amidotransferase subunit GatB [Deltaproteobacteria bacterium]
MEYEAVIGLEVHAQLLTKSKTFCGCSTEFGASPNRHTCPVCQGMPGALPVLNKKVVEFAMIMALATGCRIAPYSRLARKNYFYPDLPKGYQISQFEEPLAQHGNVEIEVNGATKRVGITRIHMEEDAGKLIHDDFNPVSYVDFNRCGVPLIEIVSEPDMRSSEEAVQYLKKLRQILQYANICDGNMEEGSFRCDANVSIRPYGQAELGTRTELKNMNSFKHVQQALDFEIRRQRSLIEAGGRVVQETRLWDTAHNRTHSMRGKEESHDYRYFPDPDLVPVVVDEAWIEEIRQRLPELPDDRKARFQREYALSDYDASVLTARRPAADYFEEVVRLVPDPKLVANWVMGELMFHLNKTGVEIENSPISSTALADVLKMIQAGTISGTIAKTVFEEMFASGKPAGVIVEEKGLLQVSDTSAIESLIRTVLEENPAELQAYKGGKKKLFGFFVGCVMKKSLGKANPQVVNETLRKLLD